MTPEVGNAFGGHVAGSALQGLQFGAEGEVHEMQVNDRSAGGPSAVTTE